MPHVMGSGTTGRYAPLLPGPPLPPDPQSTAATRAAAALSARTAALSASVSVSATMELLALLPRAATLSTSVAISASRGGAQLSAPTASVVAGAVSLQANVATGALSALSVLFVEIGTPTVVVLTGDNVVGRVV